MKFPVSSESRFHLPFHWLQKMNINVYSLLKKNREEEHREEETGV